MPEDTCRLWVHIPRSVDRRLRLAKFATGADMGDIVTAALDEHLPAAEDLAAEIARKENADARRS